MSADSICLGGWRDCGTGDSGPGDRCLLAGFFENWSHNPGGKPSPFFALIKQFDLVSLSLGFFCRPTNAPTFRREIADCI